MTEQKYSILEQKANNFQNVCTHAVRLARDKRRTPALACYYFLKQQYTNGVIYDHRPRMGELATIVGVSQRTLYAYLGWLKKYGFVRPLENNLLLTSTGTLKRTHRERRKTQITVTDSETLQTIEARLLGKLLEDHARKIEHYRRIKRFERKNTRTRDAHKKQCHETGPGFSLSIRNIQRLFNLGRNKAVSAIQLLNDLGVIRTTETRPIQAGKAPRGMAEHIADMTQDLPGHFFVYKGLVYVHYGNIHTLIEHPLPQRELTYRQYIALNKRLLQKTTQPLKALA